MLEQCLHEQVTAVVQTTIEAALEEELQADWAVLPAPTPRRSGFFQRVLDTHYGRIAALRVPKLRHGNKGRQWRILQRYQRELSSLLGLALYLYVMGLSLRDLQEALFLLLGAVLSLTAVNRVTMQVQQRMEQMRHAPVPATPPILNVDGVWVTIQYTLDTFKEDQAGHLRQCRQAEDRVILAALAVWPDGSYAMYHYEVASTEDEASWLSFFDHLLARGVDPTLIQLIVSDGSNGLLAAMRQRLPNAQLQRCITHKVRGLNPYLTYQHLPDPDASGQPLEPATAKQQRRTEIQADA